MKRINRMIVVAALIAISIGTSVQSATVLKLFWLGNSFTGAQDGLQNVVRDMINAGGSGVTVAVSDASIKWGLNLDAQFNDAAVMNKIATGDYTHVILQGYEPEGGDANVTIGYGYRLAVAAKAAGKIPVIFMTHPVYLRVDCFDTVTSIFSILADSADAPKVPCFPAWRMALAERPGIMLWALAQGCDSHHQGYQGQYLDACVFYSYFTGKSPEGNSHIPSESTVTTEEAAFLQRIGWEAWRTFVHADTLAPRLVSATGFSNEGVMVQMNKPVDQTVAQQVSHWSLTPSQTIQSATVQDGGMRIYLSVPGLTAGNYTLRASGIADTVTPHNVMPSAMTCNVAVAGRTPWAIADIGYPFTAGSTITSTATAVTIASSSLGIYYAYDQMRFAHQRCRGNFSITTRVKSITNHGPARCGGLIARESDDPISPMVGSAWPHNAPTITARGTYGSYPTDFGWGSQVPTATPYWMRLTRVGNLFTYSFSTNGTEWTTTGTTTLALKQDLLVGLTASSGDCETDTVAFDNIAVTGVLATGVATGRPASALPSGISMKSATSVYTLAGKRVAASDMSTHACLLYKTSGGVSPKIIRRVTVR